MRHRDASTGWPVTLTAGGLVLRPLVLRDATAWVELRKRNTAWLAPWESTPPGRRVGDPTVAGFFSYALDQRRLAAEGSALPFAIVWHGALVGQISVAAVTRGAVQSASIGYWIDERHAGRGIVPTAVAMVVDHCFTAAGLHRVEINVRPENTASLRVVAKLGFREEGIRRGFLYVDGAFRDHVAFALLHEDVAPAGLLARWLARSSQHD
ncbi:MAG: [ribosomal protein S5]-alanine N-acetyltransferase [Frankiaceae bacterium]|nr:[ribosomal protein S5]-alanine N-acetyltransferase [Frankiaceae bacterium]